MKEIIPPAANTHVDVLCDVCDTNTRVPGYGLQYGTLQARWGYGSRHDGEHYRLQLCETCFFYAISTLRRERMVKRLFDEQGQDLEHFGRVDSGDYWAER